MVVSRRFACFVIVVALASPGCRKAGSMPGEEIPDTDMAPLPPLASTPIGLLLEHAVDLELTDAQVQQMRGIDEAMARKNEPLEDELRDLERPEEPDPFGARAKAGHKSKVKPKRLSMTAGSGHATGAVGGGPDEGEPEKLSPEAAEAMKKAQQHADALLEQIAHNKGVAIGQALDLLDEAQRARAESILRTGGSAAPAGDGYQPPGDDYQPTDDDAPPR